MATKKPAKKSATKKTAAKKVSPKKVLPRKAAPKKTAGKKSAELKTKPTAGSVDAFLASVDPSRRDDVKLLNELLTRVTGEPPKLWGSSIVGYGSYHYVYESGREGDWALTGFSPRKANLTLYLMDGFDGREALLRRLGPHSVGKSCLYVKRVADLDVSVLEELVKASIAGVRARYPG